ncbi:MAG: PAS domain S-box protein, partial [archaeon]|nr:PAS domain S-box protein [archaeon]
MATDKILIDSEKKYRELHEKSPNSRVIANSDGSILDCNSATVKLFGFKKNELIGRNYKNLGVFSSEQIPIFEKIYQDLIQDRNPGQEQVQIIKKDGSIGWVLMQSSIITLGRDILIESIFQDITERKKVEDELLHIRKAVESTSDAIGLSDPQGHHFFQNQAFSDLFEYSIKELAVMGGGTALYNDENIGKEVFDAIMSGNSWVGEVIMKSKSERIFPVFIRADAIIDNNGNIIGLIGVHTDITERKKGEQELKNSEEKYRQAFNQAEFYKDVFTHDINNILNAIQLSSELSTFSLNEPEKIKELMDIIVRHVERGAKLVKDIQKL